MKRQASSSPWVIASRLLDKTGPRVRSTIGCHLGSSTRACSLPLLGRRCAGLATSTPSSPPAPGGHRPLPGMLDHEAFKGAVEREEIDTVIVAFTDLTGRQLGKRYDAEYVLDHFHDFESHACDYLLTIGLDMNPLDGFRAANWCSRYFHFFSSYFIFIIYLFVFDYKINMNKNKWKNSKLSILVLARGSDHGEPS